MRTLPFNVTGNPVIAVPVDLVDGLPVGIQIIGPLLGEARINRIANAYEVATDFVTLTPPPVPGDVFPEPESA
jgi:aspartyl-tRNA(Asn)/glutamyl-tRNA(Gln) amidotransferase subunit A